MKRVITLILLLIMSMLHLSAQELHTVRGRIINTESQPIPFATVVILDSEEQVAGGVTEESGEFSLKAPAGDYTLRLQYVGYESLDRELALLSSIELGDITLQESSTEIEGVEVTAHIIRREADRFVVDVANSPAAIGKDGSELLKSAPGVWVEEDGISVNGSSGTKVYINEREVKLEGEQLIIYLRSLRAEDISKIEVIPLSGADYDADSSAGIIKITLKQRRNDGLMSSATYNITTSEEYGTQHNAYLSLNYNYNRLNLYGSAWYYGGESYAHSREETSYALRDMNIVAASRLNESISNGGAKVGAIYEIDSRHSIGAEFDFWHTGNNDITPSTTEIRQGEIFSHNKSLYNTLNDRNNYVATLNYIYKLDTLGSTLKILTDYTHRSLKGSVDSNTEKSFAETLIDSLYRERTAGIYDIFTTTLAIEKSVSPKWQIRTGAKYTLNKTDNSAEYRYLNQGEWQPSIVDDYSIDYTENIAALYFIASGRMGRFSLTAGLRGEYTHTEGKSNAPRQNYFSLFPNANLSYQLDKVGKHSLIASYSRTIRRPGFWDLTPARLTISDYTYQIGNPELEPAFKNQYSLTLVMWHRYTLTALVAQNQDEIQQIILTDPNDEDKVLLTYQNFPDSYQYYVGISAPVQVTKWWQWNNNLSFVTLAQRITPEASLEYSNILQWYTAMTFTLPAKFILELTYNGQSRAKVVNIELDERHDLGVSIKKRLFKDRLTLHFTGNNLLDRETKISTSQSDFRREMRIKQPWGGRTYTFGISWNFQTGKSFRSRTIESGSQEERARM